MIIAQVPELNLYIHGAKNWLDEHIYLIVYGLEVSRFRTKESAFRYFIQCIKHTLNNEVDDE